MPVNKPSRDCAGMSAPIVGLMQNLSVDEAHRVLTDLSSLSDNLQRLVFERASAIVAARNIPKAAPRPQNPRPDTAVVTVDIDGRELHPGRWQ